MRNVSSWPKAKMVWSFRAAYSFKPGRVTFPAHCICPVHWPLCSPGPLTTIRPVQWPLYSSGPMTTVFAQSIDHYSSGPLTTVFVRSNDHCVRSVHWPLFVRSIDHCVRPVHWPLCWSGPLATVFARSTGHCIRPIHWPLCSPGPLTANNIYRLSSVQVFTPNLPNLCTDCLRFFGDVRDVLRDNVTVVSSSNWKEQPFYDELSIEAKKTCLWRYHLKGTRCLWWVH